MPSFPRRILDVFATKHTAPVNRFEGFQANGAVVIRDRSENNAYVLTENFRVPSADDKSSIFIGGAGCELDWCEPVEAQSSVM